MQIQMVNRAEAEKVFLTVENAEGAELEPGKVVEWSNTATDADQGYQVELVDSAISTTAGIGGNKVAGVVDSTINSEGVGRIQVFGPANVRSSASYNLSNLVAAGSINATNQGHVTTVAGHSDHGINYVAALVGHTLEAGPNATNATVQISYCL
tara:strand:+ start:4627 stop:5088 length:462 start_codon:yes stop_codon:yes gene_type:complete